MWSSNHRRYFFLFGLIINGCFVLKDFVITLMKNMSKYGIQTQSIVMDQCTIELIKSRLLCIALMILRFQLMPCFDESILLFNWLLLLINWIGYWLKLAQHFILWLFFGHLIFHQFLYSLFVGYLIFFITFYEVIHLKLLKNIFSLILSTF